MPQLSSPKQLLLVNANPERLQTLEKLLFDGTDFKVIAVDNAKDAVEKLKTESIDFIVSNIKLEGFDGWRLARLIRSGVLKCKPETPIVIVANTWCDHIANTTAREFGINKLIAYQDHHLLVDIINKNQLTPLENMEKSSLLVIEDNPDTRHLVNRILSPRFDIDSAEDGEKGLELWRNKLSQNQKYSLVLLDVMLPGKDGI